MGKDWILHACRAVSEYSEMGGNERGVGVSFSGWCSVRRGVNGMRVGVKRESCDCVIAAAGTLMIVRKGDRELSGRGTGDGSR